MKATPAVAEKDFWVTWVLDRLFADAELARLLMFCAPNCGWRSGRWQRGCRMRTG